jgi:hypothetical protein
LVAPVTRNSILIKGLPYSTRSIYRSPGRELAAELAAELAEEFEARTFGHIDPAAIAAAPASAPRLAPSLQPIAQSRQGEAAQDDRAPLAHLTILLVVRRG